jgi:hypothetical protein
MIKKIILIFFILVLCKPVFVSAQVCCGGGVYDVAVLSLNKRALFNLGYKFDNFMGVWDSEKEWRENNNTVYQMTPSFSSAYRFNKHLQAGVLIPFNINKIENPGVPSNGSGISDIVINGRYEFFHEYGKYKEKGKLKKDESTPYLAATLGFTFPTGKSDESAESEVDITGKGYFTSNLGISVVKTVLKDKLQLGADLGWQHSFEKTYEKYYGQELGQSYTRQQGDRLNYAITVNYLLNYWHSASFSFGGFTMNNYKLNGSEQDNTNENAINFVLSYTYYPSEVIRISPLFKWNIFSSNMGKNATGSYLLGINVVYYIENLEFDELK